MAKLEQRPTVTCECSLRLTEGEMRFLDALVGYGWKSFIEVFEGKLGKAYIEAHKASGEEFFAAVRSQIPAILRRADAARAAFNPTPPVADPSRAQGGTDGTA
jgi:hypothetical protein